MVLSSTLSFQALLTFPYPTLSSLITLSSLALTHVHDILLIVVCLTSPEYKLHKSRVLPVFVHYSITQLVGLVHCRHLNLFVALGGKKAFSHYKLSTGTFSLDTSLLLFKQCESDHL